MGMSTFLSLNRSNGLPNRLNVVLTRRAPEEIQSLRERGVIGPDVVVEHSLRELGDQANSRESLVRVLSQPAAGRETFIIGGASVYARALELQFIDEIYATFVHANVAPPVSPKELVHLDFELYAWKRFVLQERERGILWEREVLGTAKYGDTEMAIS